MNLEQIKEHLKKYAKSLDWPTDDETLIDIILNVGNELHSKKIRGHRWYDDYQYVKEFDGLLIGYVWHEWTGDNSAEDLGLEFDWSKVKQMKPIQVTITSYEPIEN